MCFQIGRIHHVRLVLGPLGGQPSQDPSKDTVVAPALPAVVEDLRRAIFLRHIAPSQSLAIDEDYAAQHPPIVNSVPAVTFGTEGTKALHLRIRQSVKIAHHQGLLVDPDSCKPTEINGSEA